MKTQGQAAFFHKGSRIGVLLVHGLTGTPAEMAAIGKRLHSYGYTVSCQILAGHCGSKEDLLATNWKDWVRSAEEAFDDLQKHTDVIFAGGISAGAVLSLHMAKSRTELIRGLSLYSTTLKWDGWSIPKLKFLLPLVLRIPIVGKRYHFVEAFPYGIKNENLRRRIVAKMESGDTSAAGHTNTPGASIRELWRMVDAIKPTLPRITTPTLLVHADNDDIASIRNAQYIQNKIAGPSTLLRLYNSYHMLTVDQERNQVADATAAYFSSLLSDDEKIALATHSKRTIPTQEEVVTLSQDGRLATLVKTS